jgi:antitoxin HigA-1
VTPNHPKIEPMHPGDYLAELMMPIAESEGAIASRLGISHQMLRNRLRKRQGVTPALALRLGTLFGNGAEFWLNLQRDYDLWHFEKELRAELANIRPLKAT